MAPRWQRRLAAIGGDDPAGRLRLSRADAKAVAAIGQAAREGADAAVMGWQLGADAGADAVLVRAALIGAPPAPGWKDEVARGAAARFPVAAADLPELHGQIKQLLSAI